MEEAVANQLPEGLVRALYCEPDLRAGLKDELHLRKRPKTPASELMVELAEGQVHRPWRQSR